MNEPRDSPQRRQQFLVICTVMFCAFVHSCTVAGVFSSMDIKEGVFPGGEFVYKYDVRYVPTYFLSNPVFVPTEFSSPIVPHDSDYATSMGLAESIGEDLTVFEKDEDLLYSVYLDDPMKMGGTRQRFATGILIDRSGRDKKKQLMDVNKEIRATVNVDDEDASIQEVWKQLEYKSTSLPSLDAAVLQFPFTNGFVSALTLSYKVRFAIVSRLSLCCFFQGIISILRNRSLH